MNHLGKKRAPWNVRQGGIYILFSIVFLLSMRFLFNMSDTHLRRMSQSQPCVPTYAIWHLVSE